MVLTSINLNRSNRYVKFISIGDKFYAVHLLVMAISKEFKALEWKILTITDDYVNSLPASDRSLDYITEEFLNREPVIMFESPVFDGRYFRFDGRHRIFGAWKLGLTSVPAIYVPREVYGQFIIGRKVERVREFGEAQSKFFDMEPIAFDRPPLARSNDDGFHYETNFELPER